MFVDIDVLRTELRRLVMEAGEEFDESEELLVYKAFISGEITAYKNVEKMLDEWEEDYRKREAENSKILKEEGNEE